MKTDKSDIEAFNGLLDNDKRIHAPCDPDQLLIVFLAGLNHARKESEKEIAVCKKHYNILFIEERKL